MTGDTLTNSDGGDQYTGLDRFGRIIDQNYVTTATGASTDRFQYAYDADGNVLYKDNLLESSDSELYHASSSASGDDSTAYDALNRLTGFERGTLSASGNNGSTLDSVSSPSQSESYSYDALGNMTSTTTNSTTTDRTTNSQNELTSVGTATLDYDNDGDTTLDDHDHTLVYDAWNRLVAVKDASTGDTLETYTYDGDGRQITDSIISAAASTPEDVTSIGSGGSISSTVNVDGTLFFIANDGTDGAQIWKSDGTSGGTVMVTDINPGSADIANLTAVGGKLFFTADDGTDGDQLWVTDGTSLGTIMLTDVSGGASPDSLANMNGTLYFTASDADGYKGVWKSDGTSSGTTEVTSSGNYPGNFVYMGGSVYFLSEDGYGSLWKTDGTSSGTTELYSFSDGQSEDLIATSDRLYFFATTYGASDKLWESNGTSGGTEIVDSGITFPTLGDNPGPGNLYAVGDRVFFTGDGSYPGLWTSDGTSAGTINLGTSLSVYDGVDYNGELYYVDGGNLWKSDGTSAGTAEVAALNISGPLTNVDGTLFFTNSADASQYLWESDGTSARTQEVSGADDPAHEADIGGTLYFSNDGHYLYVLPPTVTTTDLYYSNQQQVLEARQDGTVTDQYVWSPFYVNDLILRDDNSTGGSLGISGSGLGERLYAQHDANYNTTALVSSGGTVDEPFLYDPWGNVTVLNANWSASTAAAAGRDVYLWTILYQGERFDSVAGVFIADRRVYSPTTSSWLSADPDGFINGADRFAFEQNNSLTGLDPEGTVVVGFYGADNPFIWPGGPHGNGSLLKDLDGDLLYADGNKGMAQIAAETGAKMFGSNSINSALQYLKQMLDTNHDGKYNPNKGDNEQPILILGYSWGGYSAIKLAQKIAGDPFFCDKEVRLVATIDPVSTLHGILGTGTYGTVPSNVDVFRNWYETDNTNVSFLGVHPHGAWVPSNAGNKAEGEENLTGVQFFPSGGIRPLGVDHPVPLNIDHFTIVPYVEASLLLAVDMAKA